MRNVIINAVNAFIDFPKKFKKVLNVATVGETAVYYLALATATSIVVQGLFIVIPPIAMFMGYTSGNIFAMLAGILMNEAMQEIFADYVVRFFTGGLYVALTAGFMAGIGYISATTYSKIAEDANKTAIDRLASYIAFGKILNTNIPITAPEKDKPIEYKGVELNVEFDTLFDKYGKDVVQDARAALKAIVENTDIEDTNVYKNTFQQKKDQYQELGTAQEQMDRIQSLSHEFAELAVRGFGDQNQNLIGVVTPKSSNTSVAVGLMWTVGVPLVAVLLNYHAVYRLASNHLFEANLLRATRYMVGGATATYSALKVAQGWNAPENKTAKPVLAVFTHEDKIDTLTQMGETPIQNSGLRSIL